MQLNPQILILASRFDFSCDYVISRLRERGKTYFRLNSEDIEKFAITVVPDEPLVVLTADGLTVRLSEETLESIYFRRAVYPREPRPNATSAQDQLVRAHRSSFMRSFMIFTSCTWVNHPVSTYRAEHKAVQLATAHQTGLQIPRTVLTNDASGVYEVADQDKKVAVKGIETVLVWEDDIETFGYTSLLETSLVARSHLSPAPLIVQQSLENKLDLRVTVVNDKLFCASITVDGKPTVGDWRLEKDRTAFTPYCLPADISQKCVSLVKALNLTFGAIDLALYQGQYYFLEINPTGEWGWLADSDCFPIDGAIADALSDGPVNGQDISGMM